MENQNSIKKNNETIYGRHDESAKRFYYGKVIQKDNTGKRLEFSVSNHLEEDKKYKFRYTAKCRAGFLNINETNYDQTPKEFINEILSETGPLEIYDSVSEHGHLFDIFQENYLDSKGVDILKASNSFSDADTYDTMMYSQGDWNLMPYFILHSLTIPKTALGTPLTKSKIRPGRCWTKFRNFKNLVKFKI